MYKSKLDWRALVQNGEPLVLDVGCGSRKIRSTAIGIDIVEAPSVDIVGDVFEFLRDLPPNCVGEIQAHHFLEHIESLEDFVLECDRVLLVGGKMRFSVPHFSNPYFYSDPTHLRFFGLYSMSYLVHSNLFKRSVPIYGPGATGDLHLERVVLRFKAPREFPVSYGLSRISGLGVGLCRATQEFYERWMTSIVPCYELVYDIVKKDSMSE